MIVIDTSALVDSLAGSRPTAHLLRAAFGRGESILLTSIVLYEWLRGPRSPEEIAAQEAIFPLEKVVAFGTPEAILSAQLYKLLTRPRAREIDIAIAASAILRGATLWTTNTSDFASIPGLKITTVP